MRNYILTVQDDTTYTERTFTVHGHIEDAFIEAAVEALPGAHVTIYAERVSIATEIGYVLDSGEWMLVDPEGQTEGHYEDSGYTDRYALA